jgi:uracil-DNA glycosylase
MSLPEEMDRIDRPCLDDWKERLAPRLTPEYRDQLRRWLAKEGVPFNPPPNMVYRALELTCFEKTKVVILGQDPYPTAGQADGLCFSVRPGSDLPQSLKNIRQVLRTDQPSAQIPEHGSLEAWAGQGVLLLNAALTVRPGAKGSHRQIWKEFIDQVIHLLSKDKPDPVVFMLWGGQAQKKEKLIDARHRIIRSSHPSNLSARRPCRGSPPFLESDPFSQANHALVESSQEPVDWTLT